jgi:hypothetical protein
LVGDFLEEAFELGDFFLDFFQLGQEILLLVFEVGDELEFGFVDLGFDIAEYIEFEVFVIVVGVTHVAPTHFFLNDFFLFDHFDFREVFALVSLDEGGEREALFDWLSLEVNDASLFEWLFLGRVRDVVVMGVTVPIEVIEFRMGDIFLFKVEEEGDHSGVEGEEAVILFPPIGTVGSCEILVEVRQLSLLLTQSSFQGGDLFPRRFVIGHCERFECFGES